MDIEIEPESITIEEGETKIQISGILSKKHAIILVGLILTLLGIKEFDIPI